MKAPEEEFASLVMLRRALVRFVLLLCLSAGALGFLLGWVLR